MAVSTPRLNKHTAAARRTTRAAAVTITAPFLGPFALRGCTRSLDSDDHRFIIEVADRTLNRSSDLRNSLRRISSRLVSTSPERPSAPRENASVLSDLRGHSEIGVASGVGFVHLCGLAATNAFLAHVPGEGVDFPAGALDAVRASTALATS